jgi:hypothetical protein
MNGFGEEYNFMTTITNKIRTTLIDGASSPDFSRLFRSNYC